MGQVYRRKTLGADQGHRLCSPESRENNVLATRKIPSGSSASKRQFGSFQFYQALAVFYLPTKSKSLTFSRSNSMERPLSLTISMNA